MHPPPYYETDRAIAEYLLFHYGRVEEVLPYDFGPHHSLEYPVRCVAECLEPEALAKSARALDLGCAVGRSTFELARHCQHVLGIDYSSRFIAVAQHLRDQGVLTYAYPVEGDLMQPASAVVPGDIDRSRVAFEHGDAQSLRPDLGTFDVVLMANLIDRLREPLRLLERLPALVQPGGQLIITSPYTWLEEYTPKSCWLGGFERDGHAATTLQALERALEPAFELVATRNLPFLIREHARKFQWSVAEGSVWRRSGKG